MASQPPDLRKTAREIHVAKTGTDAGTGTVHDPFLTVNQAARAAQPGDTVLVHAGTYREWVKPIRGGRSDQERIVYRAAPDEEVFLKGSEPIATWVAEGHGVWRADVPNAFFGDYNPFALSLSGEWLVYGGEHHRGDVYLDGEAFCEQTNLEAVQEQEHTWFTRVSEQTVIWANFGAADPNRQLAEINVRESVFMPEVSGLRYITVDGFHLAHSAENWQPPCLRLQMGAIGPRMGKHWIIENCTITHARCVGIVLGHAPDVDHDDIDAYGDHVIRNNVIRRCGQAGIAGQKGATRSVIQGNFIEDTNYRKEFGGWETAAIKFHQSVDTVIRGNLIRGVYRQQCGAYGIWMDWGNQGTRISGNVVYNTDEATLYLEMNHGPILVDNNVFIGAGIRQMSEATVFAHNLFVDSWFEVMTDTDRSSEYCAPHTRRNVGTRAGLPREDKWFNNIFVRGGLDKVQASPGYVSDHNVFLEEAKPSTFGDQYSVVDPRATGFRREDKSAGVILRLMLNAELRRVKALRVDAGLAGVFTTTGQALEDRYGQPLQVDIDYRGMPRLRPIPGPLANPKPGPARLAWPPEKGDQLRVGFSRRAGTSSS